ncbi:hypothetical protein CBS101457_006909 [Exobasidium rhododendri]|nr:hypothetical protein CBS101457_006909 [Exobasidium rhododendri]
MTPYSDRNAMLSPAWYESPHQQQHDYLSSTRPFAADHKEETFQLLQSVDALLEAIGGSSSSI